jgi:hypothetical protein
MTQLSQEIRDHEWLDCYDKFSCFVSKKVRDGCYSRIMEHAEPTKKAIVLVHSLFDSGGYCRAFSPQHSHLHLLIPTHSGLKSAQKNTVLSISL